MKLKHSIRKKMTIIFSVVLLASLTVCWLANTFFMEHYYLINKKNVLVELYRELDLASGQEELEKEEFMQRVGEICAANALDLFIMDSDGTVKIYSMKDYQVVRDRLYAYLFGQIIQGGGGRILENNDSYTIRMNRGSHKNIEYLEIAGFLREGEVFMVRTALEPIRESAVLANRFLTRVGIVTLLLGIWIIQRLSGRIAEPILELAKLSERMSNLNFNVKFQGKEDDEIAFLGNHMNQLSETLERTISELKTANNELMRDIEQRRKIDEMRKEFLSNVSHELKTPIALIQGYAEGLKECVNDDEESREFYCEVIMDEAGKMNSMVKNLLTLNELEFGNEVVEMERFDLTALIDNLLQSSKILFEQKQVKLVFDVREPVYVWANEFKMGEVMNNYISNALNHVEGEKIIKITVQRLTGQVRVGVFNTGKPIPEQDLDRIWDKFYKVDKARTREYGGNGVGLSIVKAIMESIHQKYGVINYENGVEFWCTLDDRAEVEMSKLPGQEE